MKKVFFLTHSPISEQEARKICERLIQQGYLYFICYAKNSTDILILQILKQLKKKGYKLQIELVCSDANLKFSLNGRERLYHDCNEFCLIDNVSNNTEDQIKYLAYRANLVYEI